MDRVSKTCIPFLLALLPLNAPGAAGPVVLSEVYYHPPASEGELLEYIELCNVSTSSVDIGGWMLRGAVEIEMPQGTILGPGAYAIVCRQTDVVLAHFSGLSASVLGDFAGALDNAGDEVELVDRFSAHVDSVPYGDELPWPEEADGNGSSLQRVCLTAPGWDPLNWVGRAPTPAEPNPSSECPPPSFASPSVVISELNYHPASRGGTRPATEDGEDEEFVELHNLSTVSLDLGAWSFAEGVTFVFPQGTILGPGGYLVVCRNEAKLRERFGITNIAGSYAGKLANDGERVALVDQLGRFVDAVEYSDNHEWPYAADGFGRSLEKVVLAAPGYDPANWEASRLLPVYQHLVGEGGLGQGLSQKFVLSINGPAEAIVDNVVLEDADNPGVNLVSNGTFDADLSGWEARGVAVGSAFAPGEGVGGGGALRLVSAGTCADIECGVANGMSQTVTIPGAPRLLKVTVDFRYVKGSPNFRAGLFRGASATVSGLASPGMANSVSSAQIPMTISAVHRFPQEPTSADTVWITAHVRSLLAPEVSITYDAGSGDVVLPMLDDGEHRDATGADGVFGAQLPAFGHNTQVRFRIRATGGGETVLSPRPLNLSVPLPEEVWGYYVNDQQVGSRLPVYQILIDGVDPDDIDAVRDALDCTVLRKGSFAERGDLYPDVGLRWRGYTACYVKKQNLKVVFHRIAPFHGLRKINLNGLWTDKSMLREHLAWEFLREIGAPAVETRFTRVHLNGQYHGLFLFLEHPDSRFLERIGFDGSGNLYKALQPIMVPGGDEQPIGVELMAKAEDYEKVWEEETNEGGDFSDLAEFIGSMHADGKGAGGPTAAFWSQRSFEETIVGYQLAQVVLNNIDSFAKNHFLYHDLQLNRWGFITWDMDLTFGKFFTSDAVAFPERPVGTLNDIMLSDIDEDLNPWFGATVLMNPRLNWLIDFFFRAGGGKYQRAYLVRLWDILEEKYRNEVYDPRLDALASSLEPEEAEDAARWGRYQSNVPGFPPRMLERLHEGGENNIDILKRQISLHREFLEDYVSFWHEDATKHPRVKITEIMYLPENGDGDLEFLELKNLGDASVDLSGWSLRGIGAEEGVFTFPPQSVVPAGEFFIVARSPDRFRSRYGGLQCDHLFGPYIGRLANEGEELRLLDADPAYPATIDYLRYDAKGPWPTVRPGRSLELTDVRWDRDNDPGENWVESAVLGGTPCAASTGLFIRGDADSDREVILTDAVYVLIHLFRGGAAPACMDAADSNDDGTVDLTDPIYLLGHLFLGTAPPPAPYPTAGLDPTLDDLTCG